MVDDHMLCYLSSYMPSHMSTIECYDHLIIIVEYMLLDYWNKMAFRWKWISVYSLMSFYETSTWVVEHKFTQETYQYKTKT